MKFGRLPSKQNSKTLKLEKYLGSSIPAPPHKVWREYKVPASLWGMFANDDIGDCTCAAIAHMLMLSTIHTGAIVTPTVEDVISAYSAVSGYDPKTKVNDNGAAITDVLEYWRNVGIAGHKILGWAAIDSKNIETVKQAIWLFGGIDIGVDFPAAASTQFNSGKPWEIVENDGGIEGGHSVPNFGYGSEGTNCITWGKRQGMTWDWFEKYCVEAYAVISEDWIVQSTKKTLGGFDLAELEKDLVALGKS